jgi:hypothetical protein
MSMSLVDFKREFDRATEIIDRFNETEDTDVVITKSSGTTLFLFMRDQEVLDYIKVSKDE